MIDIKAHILNQIEITNVEKEPFYSLYIEDILPSDFYNEILTACLHYKYNHPKLELRMHDITDCPNKKYNVEKATDSCLVTLKKLFEDADIKTALLRKFYKDETLMQLTIKEYEFVYTEKNKFQNIHTDIPAKFLSFVFYLPEIKTNQNPLSETEERENGTILYNHELNPVYKTKYRANSVTIFAPHFYSYHGFHTTIENRNTLIFFYYDPALLFHHDSKPIPFFLSKIREKLEKYTLLEYEYKDIARILNDCQINAKSGRVIKSVQ